MNEIFKIGLIVKPQGIKGEPGNGISDISYTRSEGLVDIYTITYTNGETSEFNVTNGKDGVGISDVYVDTEGYLIISLTDGTVKRFFSTISSK